MNFSTKEMPKNLILLLIFNIKRGYNGNCFKNIVNGEKIMNETLKTIHERRSVRAFKPDRITKEELTTILEAGIAAPSAMNRQPWHFTAIQNQEIIRRIEDENRGIVFSTPENAANANRLNDPAHRSFYNAPTVIMFSGDIQNPWSICDCALAMQNMVLAAKSLSIGTCIIGSTGFAFQAVGLKDWFHEIGVPQGYSPLFAIAVGYAAADSEPKPRNKECVNFV